METLGVYIQIPFCSSKCSFCNFSSRVVPRNWADAYGRALLEELARLPASYEAAGVGKRLLGLPVDTLYVGGGTPPLLGTERLRAVLGALSGRLNLSGLREFTVEVTPGSAHDDFLEAARAFGVNRLSIGAQSFDDRELRAVGRLHSAGETRELVSRARRAGYKNLNLDLIAGLPHQTMGSWLASLRAVLELRPEHLSIYLFEIDEKSRLGREVLSEGARYHAAEVPGEEFMAGAYEKAREVLAGEGYRQYEISNFALPGCESRHNRKYWRLEPYVGLGAGAHCFDGACRWVNEEAVEHYESRLERNNSPIAQIRRLTPEEQVEEFFFLGLRQQEGIDLRSAFDRWGRARVSPWLVKISTLAHEGWLEREAAWVRLPSRAYLVSNEIFQEFLV